MSYINQNFIFPNARNESVWFFKILAFWAELKICTSIRRNRESRGGMMKIWKFPDIANFRGWADWQWTTWQHNFRYRLLWGETKNVPVWDYNIFLDFSSISIIFGVEVGMDHNFFFHTFKSSYGLFLMIYHVKSLFSHFSKQQKTPPWLDFFEYKKSGLVDFVLFLDSGTFTQ